MSLSRKRRKELKRLQSNAGELWGNQQIVLEHANAVAREASRQLGHLTREEVVPRVRTGTTAMSGPTSSGPAPSRAPPVTPWNARSATRSARCFHRRHRQ